MATMTHLLLAMIIFIFGTLHMSALAGDVAPDYDYEDESLRSPANLAQSTIAPVLPYFEQTKLDVYVQPNATSIKLDCPVKNYDAPNHVIMWYRDNRMITTGKEPIVSIYSLDKNFSLTSPLPDATGHNFSCHIMPANVSHNITINLGSPPTTPPSAATIQPSSGSGLIRTATTNCLILIASLWLTQSSAVRF